MDDNERPGRDDSRPVVLVVDDEPPIRRIVIRMLRRASYRVIECEEGEKAIDHVAREDMRIDLVLTDVVMPSMPGPDLARRLREIDPGLPIVFMSGYSGATIGDTAGMLAEHPLLQKPFTTDELLEAVRESLRER